MREFLGLSMDGERKTQISPEELEDEDFEDKADFFNPDDNWDEDSFDEDDEPYEREYCD